MRHRRPFYVQYEIHVTGSLKHRHIAKLYYYAHQAEVKDRLGKRNYLMIMEDGGITLENCVRRNKLPNGKATLTILEHTNKGLAYLHYYSSESEKIQVIGAVHHNFYRKCIYIYRFFKE